MELILSGIKISIPAHTGNIAVQSRIEVQCYFNSRTHGKHHSIDLALRSQLFQFPHTRET